MDIKNSDDEAMNLKGKEKEGIKCIIERTITSLSQFYRKIAETSSNEYCWETGQGNKSAGNCYYEREGPYRWFSCMSSENRMANMEA